MNPQEYQTVIQAGKNILLCPSKAIEAFSKNALYSSRGMGRMKQYKTVKEVCALTGLTRKHLYYFHHENVVHATAYANYSVEGNDGYKLYDDAAVEKLQQIALYYRMGLKRNEIRDIMRSPDYDANQTLATLLAQKVTEKEKLQQQIAALRFLKRIGIQNGLAGFFRCRTLEELGQALIDSQQEQLPFDSSQLSAFETEFGTLLSKLQRLPAEELDSPHGVHLIQGLISLCDRYWGENGVPFLWGMLLGAAGNGTIAQSIHPLLSQELSSAILRCISKNPQLQPSESDPRVGV